MDSTVIIMIVAASYVIAGRMESEERVKSWGISHNQMWAIVACIIVLFDTLIYIGLPIVYPMWQMVRNAFGGIGVGLAMMRVMRDHM